MTTLDQLAPAQTAGAAPLYATVSRPASEDDLHRGRRVSVYDGFVDSTAA